MTDAPGTDEQETSSQQAAALDDDLAEPEGADVPLTDHAPARQATGPEQRGTGGSG